MSSRISDRRVRKRGADVECGFASTIVSARVISVSAADRSPRACASSARSDAASAMKALSLRRIRDRRLDAREHLLGAPCVTHLAIDAHLRQQHALHQPRIRRALAARERMFGVARRFRQAVQFGERARVVVELPAGHEVASVAVRARQDLERAPIERFRFERTALEEQTRRPSCCTTCRRCACDRGRARSCAATPRHRLRRPRDSVVPLLYDFASARLILNSSDGDDSPDDFRIAFAAWTRSTASGTLAA